MTSPRGALTRVLLAALAKGIERGSANVARQTIPKRDLLLFLIARRRLSTMLERARTLSFEADPVHQMRLVSLELVGAEFEGNDTPSLVEQRYDERVRPLLGPTKPTFWTLMAAAPVAFAALAFGVYSYAHRPFDPHDDPMVALLEESLSQWTVEVAANKTSAIEERVRSEDTTRVLGGDVARAVLATFDSGLDAARAGAQNLKQESARFTASQVALNQALMTRRLPVFVDGTLISLGKGLSPLLMTYYVEQEELWQYRDRRLRTVSAWRLDPVRLRLPALGYVREGNPVAIISYDLIESVLILYLLPSLMNGEPAFVFDEQTRFTGNPLVTTVESRLGAALRAHFDSRHLGADARRLGQLLAARRNLIAKWRRTITGFPVRAPERLLPERNLGKRLETFISRGDVGEWDEINGGLSEPEMVAAFERERDEWAGVIKRHELQHLIDQEEVLVGIPVGLAQRLSVDPATEPEPYSLFGAARAELSAYLAEIAYGPHPRLSLVQLTAAVFDRSMRHTPHHFAALAVFDGLMKSVGVAGDHTTYEEAVVRVVESEPKAMRLKARELYESCFGRAVAALSRIESVEHKHWRH